MARGRQCENRGRDWNDVAASQELLGTHRKVEARHGTDLPSP